MSTALNLDKCVCVWYCQNELADMTLDSGGRPHGVGYQWGTAFLCQND